MRTVSYDEGQNFAKKHNLLYVEASAKTKQDVEEVNGLSLVHWLPIALLFSWRLV
jgi:hypothetical protein